MGVRVSNSEIMEIFKKVDEIKADSNLSEEEINRQVKMNHDLIVQKMSFLVYGQARQYIMFPNYEDIVQEGFIGLIRAIQQFEWPRYPNFFAYSDQWIRNGVKRAAGHFDIVYNPNRTRVIYSEPDENEVAPDDTPYEALFNKERKDYIAEILSEFSEIDRKIVQKIFGLEGNKVETLREIGPQFNLSHERIRQIKNSVIDKLRKDLRLQEIT